MKWQRLVVAKYSNFFSGHGHIWNDDSSKKENAVAFLFFEERAVMKRASKLVPHLLIISIFMPMQKTKDAVAHVVAGLIEKSEATVNLPSTLVSEVASIFCTLP